MTSVKQTLIEIALPAYFERYRKLKEINAPTIILWNTRKILRKLQKGELGIRGLSTWENEEVKSLEYVTGKRGRIHKKIELTNGQTIGIFRGPYSTFAKIWEDKHK